MRTSSIFAPVLLIGVALVHTPSLAQSRPQPPVLLSPSALPQCSDGIDNDGDGMIDFPSNGLPGDGVPTSGGDDGCYDPTDNDERAGLPAGTTLRTTGDCASSTLTTASHTYDGCLWNGSVNVNAANITIQNSEFHGNLYGSTTNINSLVVQDSTAIRGYTGGGIYYFAGPNNTAGSYTMRRMRLIGYSSCWYSESAITVEDSVCKQLSSDEAGAHVENILLSDNGAATIRRNWLMGNERAGTNIGFSAVISLYSHNPGGFVWADTFNKTITNNRIQMIDNHTWYSMYGGNSCDGKDDSSGNPTNPTGMTLTGNTFIGAMYSSGVPAIIGWHKAPTNAWSGNVRSVTASHTHATAAAWAEPDGCY